MKVIVTGSLAHRSRTCEAGVEFDSAHAGLDWAEDTLRSWNKDFVVCLSVDSAWGSAYVYGYTRSELMKRLRRDGVVLLKAKKEGHTGPGLFVTERGKALADASDDAESLKKFCERFQ